MNTIKTAQIMIDRTLPLISAWYYKDGDADVDHYVTWASGIDFDNSIEFIYNNLLERLEFNETHNFSEVVDFDLVLSILKASLSEDPIIKQDLLNTAERLFMEYNSKNPDYEFGALELSSPILKHGIDYIWEWVDRSYYLGIDPLESLRIRFPWINWEVSNKLRSISRVDYKYPTYKLDEKPLIIIEREHLEIVLIVCVLDGEDESNLGIFDRNS